MDELPDEARRLIEQARAAATPSAADRERVWSALAAQLTPTGGEPAQPGGESAATTPEAGSATSGAASGVGAKLTLALVGVVLALGVGSLAMREPPASTSERPLRGAEPGAVHGAGDDAPASVSALGEPSRGAAPATASEGGSAPRAHAEDEQHDEASAEASGTPHAPAAATAGGPARERAPSGTTTAPAGDDIAADVALLHEAQAAWRAGRASDALRLAEEHRSRFPRSALGRERDAIRVLALCALGRDESARRIASRLLSSSGSSPWRQAVAESCGGR